MNRNVPSTTTSESSLLLQIPKSVLSFSDMSGNSFLMPVAVAPEIPAQDTLTSEKHEGTSKVIEPTSVCQLQQPLLVRRGSSPGPKMDVPYSESVVHTSNVDSIQTEVLHSMPPSQPPVPNVGVVNQGTVNLTWSTTNPYMRQPVQSNPIFSGPQNEPPTVQPKSLYEFSSQTVQVDQESSNFQYSNISSQQMTMSASSNYLYENSPTMKATFSEFSNKTDDFHNVSTSADYYSQPPVITPSTTPSYYNSSAKNISHFPQSSCPDTSDHSHMHSSDIPSEMYYRTYEPVKPHWFFLDIVENREIWCAFSICDSEQLEEAFQKDNQAVIQVDGGRYDALLSERVKKPVYFDAKVLQIRRCTWFYRPDSSQRFVPFPEESSSLLENHFATCVTSGHWQKIINLPGLGSVVMENSQTLLYYKNEVELWPTLPDSRASPKLVRRGLPETFEIPESENSHVDHLVFIVQGIGSVCDLKFRTVAECVDGVRDIASKLVYSHFRHQVQCGQVGRVEFLPVAWHAKLHTSDEGFDRCMQNITLPSIPKLRHFTNDTLLDILLYSSPFYCQSILDTVASDLNKLYEVFLQRNPEFSGKVFVAGHSLGSLILFDILSHQRLEDTNNGSTNGSNSDKDSPKVKDKNPNISEKSIQDSYESVSALLEACHLEEYTELFEKEKIDLEALSCLSNDDLKDIGIPTGPRKKLLNVLKPNDTTGKLFQTDEAALNISPDIALKDQYLSDRESQYLTDGTERTFPLISSPCMQSISYPRLHFEPACFFALGSPISMFLAVRGYHSITEDFRFPTCPGFFHIFHPYDPVAYRIEPLIDANFSAKPVLIPHHKGRKRMHLEIRENLSRVGSEIKQKVLETLKYTWNSLSGFAKAHTFPSDAMEAEVDKLVCQQLSESEFVQQAPSETSGEEIQIGSLNGGRRIDYVLQEKPIEALNDYVFALTSHATYWDSEDTVLMILREIYATQGIMVSSQSIIENRQFNQPELSTYETYSDLNSVMSSSHSYESTGAQQIPAMPFYNQSTPQTIPVSSQSVHSYSSYNASVSQFVNTVPPAPPPAVTMQQPVGPPPLSGFVKKSPFAR